MLLVNMRSYWVKMSPNLTTSVLIKRDKRDTQIHREEDHVRMQAQMAVICLQARNRQRLPATTDQDSLNVSLNLTKTDFFPDYRPLNYLFFQRIYFGKLAVVNFFSIPLRCKSFLRYLLVDNLGVSFLKYLRVIPLKCNYQRRKCPLSQSLQKSSGLTRMCQLTNTDGLIILTN